MMTKSRLLLVALFTVVLSGAALARSQWPSSSTSEATPSVEAADAFDSPAAWRYRQSQPSHWRNCMLQR
jgi:hypothetical protein